MWLMLGQLEEARGRGRGADGVHEGMSAVPRRDPPVDRGGDVGAAKRLSAKARAILEQARDPQPQNERLWLAATRQERAADPSGVDPEAIKAADALLSKGLQECPRERGAVGRGG